VRTNLIRRKRRIKCLGFKKGNQRRNKAINQTFNDSFSNLNSRKNSKTKLNGKFYNKHYLGDLKLFQGRKQSDIKIRQKKIKRPNSESRELIIDI